MAKAYWVATYRAIKDPESMAAYAKLSRPAIEAAGGRVLARGMPAAAFELGQMERVVLIEFDSVESAKAAYASPAYQKAHDLLGDGADRDIRVVEAAE
ncbi:MULTISPECIES: DUF1330 domain-containing protein [unclassified Bradyrhizobium]|jgi:uncharacterized protein (DUF1330 family)|uniref:DUF1330 domain-containing protein n=1 Tax=unclassified Bradyrhizobium TaxID=2631580 RepID=UPI00070DFA5B|nr:MULTISPECIES: DUF1330 domain-containing protein [unclassified Bradyrhizobium]KQT28345.1 hypothetical protein ASG57_16870 [Bradyrhizobium sp. Leaf396]